MALEKFAMATMAEIDGGRIREAFDQALRRCEIDCKDRPGDGAARVVNMTVRLTPVLDVDGEMNSVDIQFQVKDSVPTRKSKVYNMRSTEGGLLFNELAPEDVRQATIDTVTEPRKVDANAG